MRVIKNQELLYAETKINLDIQEISYAFLDSEWNFRNFRSAFTRIYLPLSGFGQITCGDTVIDLVPNNIYIIPSGVTFSCSCPRAMEKIFFHLTLTHPNGRDILSDISTCLILKDCKSITEQMSALYARRDLGSVLRIKQLLYEIVASALSLCPLTDPTLTEYSVYTQAALRYIDGHLRADLSIGELASALFITKTALQKHFKTDLGRPVGQYIDHCLMAEAERYLSDRSLSVKEISDRLGFCDQFYFSRKFSKAHGISPRRFRQMYHSS